MNHENYLLENILQRNKSGRKFSRLRYVLKLHKCTHAYMHKLCVYGNIIIYTVFMHTQIIMQAQELMIY